MPRPTIRKRIWLHPCVRHFRPEGVRMANAAEVIITLEELESVRLSDMQEMTQKEAAKKMGISQPTFQRLLESAHRKIAEALIDGKAIRIEGGHNVFLGKGIHHAHACKCPRGRGAHMHI